LETRFHNPYEHWVAGLLTEIGLFIAFLLGAAALVLVAARFA
jgi:hypothetical protein